MSETVKEKIADLRTVVVECKLEDTSHIKEFKVDADIFDDILLEASTRFMEKYIQQGKTKIAPILTAYDKKDVNNYDKYYCYNTYYVTINAGFYNRAEVIRKNFLLSTKIDLKKESLRGQNERTSSRNN